MPLLQPETMTRGETTFTIGCLPATVGWDLSAKVANILGTTNVSGLGSISMPHVSAVTASPDASDNPAGVSDVNPATMAMGAGIIKALMAIPAADLRQVRNALFEYVEFTNGRAATAQKLAGAEEMAFNAAGLSSLDIWKVFAASFRLNFSEYWVEIISLLRALPNSRLSRHPESQDLSLL